MWLISILVCRIRHKKNQRIYYITFSEKNISAFVEKYDAIADIFFTQQRSYTVRTETNGRTNRKFRIANWQDSASKC
nr:MAG TPA: hypothetical protein [Bacteriophage sp.]